MNRQQLQTCITAVPKQAQTHDKRHPSTEYKSQAMKIYGSKETSTPQYHCQSFSSTPIIQLSDVVVRLIILFSCDFFFVKKFGLFVDFEFLTKWALGAPTNRFLV